jgi:hypothetical protein
MSGVETRPGIAFNGDPGLFTSPDIEESRDAIAGE